MSLSSLHHSYWLLLVAAAAAADVHVGLLVGWRKAGFEGSRGVVQWLVVTTEQSTEVKDDAPDQVDVVGWFVVVAFEVGSVVWEAGTEVALVWVLVAVMTKVMTMTAMKWGLATVLMVLRVLVPHWIYQKSVVARSWVISIRRGCPYQFRPCFLP